MARNLPTPPFSALPVMTLSEMANDMEPMERFSPKEWFDRTLYETEKATIAERFGHKEELFVAYVRACKCYTNLKLHPQYLQVKRQDPKWGAKAKDYREVCRATSAALVGKGLMADV